MRCRDVDREFLDLLAEAHCEYFKLRFRNSRRVGVVECRDARPDDLQLRRTVRIWTGDVGVGGHPVIFVGHSLLGGQQGQNGRYAMSNSLGGEVQTHRGCRY